MNDSTSLLAPREGPVDLAVYFNLDGTLVDVEPGYSSIVRRVLGEFGVPTGDRDPDAFAGLVSEAFEEGESKPLRSAFGRYFEEQDLSCDAAEAAGRFTNLELEAVEPAEEGVPETLEEFRRHCEVGVLTRGLGELQRAKLRKIQVNDLLDDVVVSGEYSATKAGGRLFEQAEEGLTTERYVYVSTRASDVEYARTAGWAGRLVESVVELEPAAVVSSLSGSASSG